MGSQSRVPQDRHAIMGKQMRSKIYQHTELGLGDRYHQQTDQDTVLRLDFVEIGMMQLHHCVESMKAGIMQYARVTDLYYGKE
jgi:hypothetical protein